MPEKLKKKIIEEYVGKIVPKKYQDEYGKKYDKKEAEQIFYKTMNKRL